MTTQEVANRFHELAQTGQWEAIQDELYAENCVSIEPGNQPGLHSAEGLAAIKAKGTEFAESVEAMHGGFSNPPIVSGNHFAVVMGMDVTFKGAPRMQMDEVAVYQVADGKIVKEQFFY